MSEPKRKRRQRRSFGKIRLLPSGNYQASYVGPDLTRHNAPQTFEAKDDAIAWMHRERDLIRREEWTPPKTRRYAVDTAPTLAEYAPGAIRRRRTRKGARLRPRTIAHYDSLLRRLIFPDLGDLTLKQITPETVADWYDNLNPDTPTLRAHAYSLLSTVFGQAIKEASTTGITANPCTIEGAGHAERARRVRIATLEEVEGLEAAMPEHLQALILIAAWCGLRFGELAELRRRDLDLSHKVLTVSRAIVRVDGKTVIGAPKSTAGERDIAIPPHIVPTIEAHLKDHVARGANALVFPRTSKGDKHLIHRELNKLFAVAREAVGRPDLRLHDLRHTSATWAAQQGASLGELMERLGHSTPEAAMRYQHAAQERDREIAARMSKFATRRDTPTNG